MAHTCPSCGQYCTCGGDWDDIALGENLNCEHCPNEFVVNKKRRKNLSRKIRRSYKSNLSKLIQNLNKLKAQSLSKGKNIPQDITIAESRLKDYLKVLTNLNKLGYRVVKGGDIVPIKNAKPDMKNF